MSNNTAPGVRIHPDFTHPQDVAVQSSDNVRFYVSAADLGRASGVYRAVLLQQPPSTPGEPQRIGSEENSTALDFLLKIATGRNPPLGLLATMDAIEEAYHAAERLQMTIATTIAMLLLRSKVMGITEDPVKQYAVASRYGWTDLQSVFLARAITVTIDIANLPSMPQDALIYFLAQREARIAQFIKVMTASDEPTLQFHHENRNACMTCISTNRTNTYLTAANLAMWRSFQVNSITRFRIFPSLEHLTECQRIASTLEGMASAKEECGHNPWKGIEKKIPHIFETIVPVQLVRQRIRL